MNVAPRDLVVAYIDKGYQLTFWSADGDSKGPKEPGWPAKHYRIEDYDAIVQQRRNGCRVGIKTGVEITPSRFLHDVDLDWAPGSLLAQTLLPPTSFVYGRSSKRISHCFYTLSEPLPSYRYEDIDKTCLIELRGTKINGEIGLQTMAPPSIWSKGAQREPLTFIKADDPVFVEHAEHFKQRVCLAAIGMLLAKHFGTHGFGHDPRLCWAGFLLRAGIGREELILMGNALSVYCSNTELGDVRRVVESTAAALAIDNKKVKGGPALAKLLGANGKAVIARINEWLGRDSDFVRVEGVIVKDHQQNIRRAVELLGKDLSYNAFSDKVLVDRVPLEDRQMNDMWLRIDEEYRFRPSFQFFEKVIGRLAYDNPFHPVKDYLASLTWDTTPRLDGWLTSCAGVDETSYTRAIGSILLIAAVRRIRHPGTKYDELVVIEGAQGLNKSSALRALCPNAEWFSDDLPLNTTSQKMIESTLGKWIIEAADLAGRRKTEIEHLKATLSRQIDGPARLAYAHLPVERPRQFVIVGTTNSAAYLSDPTGARRFWPVLIKQFDVTKVRELRDQLWAEASTREAHGESIRLPESLWPDAAMQQEKRREIDPWEQAIRTLLLVVTPSGDNKRRVAVDHLWDGLGIQIERRDRFGAIRIADIMHRFGFKRTTVRSGDDVVAGYVTDNPELLVVREDTRIVGEDDVHAVGERVETGDEPPF